MKYFSRFFFSVLVFCVFPFLAHGRKASATEVEERTTENYRAMVVFWRVLPTCVL